MSLFLITYYFQRFAKILIGFRAKLQFFTEIDGIIAYKSLKFCNSSTNTD